LSELSPNRSPSPAPKGKQREQKRTLKRARFVKHAAQRQQAINSPNDARVRPVAISPKDFSLATGLSPATIARAIRDGRLKSVRILGRRLISYSELERVRRGE
jgi:hypothetical protein